MSECNCRLCIERTRLVEICHKLPKEDQEWIAEFYSQIDNERLVANVNEAILDGTWASAIEYLEHALVKARNFRDDNAKRKS